MKKYLKYLGAFLIFVGIFIVFYSMHFTSQIYLYGENPPEIFEDKNIMLEDIISIEGEDEEEFLGAIKEDVGLEDIVPISQVLNMSAVVLFATFFVFAGVKITTMGVVILRENEKDNS